MIKTKEDLKEWLSLESPYSGLKNKIFPQPQMTFVKMLRRFEYHYNNRHSIFHKFMLVYYYYRYYKAGLGGGISIPKNTCGKGLTLYHFGSIVLNGGVRIGKNCCIMNNVNIGANGGSEKCPRIGNDVYIGPGAVIYGDIEIADGCYIGANAVVNKSFIEKHSIIAGIPAKVIGKSDKTWWEKNGLKR